MTIPNQAGPRPERTHRVRSTLGPSEVATLHQSGDGVSHGNISQLAGRGRGHRVYWFILVAAAGVDVVTFYQVLLLVMNVEDAYVWVAVSGFTLVALSLAHWMGRLARDRVPQHRPALTSTPAWYCASLWLAMGITAFVVRCVIQNPIDRAASRVIVDGVQVNEGSLSGSTFVDQILPALLFLVLYLSTGTIAALAGFTAPGPAASQYQVALDRQSRIVKDTAGSAGDLALVEEMIGMIHEVMTDREEAWQLTKQDCAMAAERMKRRARLQLRLVEPPRLDPFPYHDFESRSDTPLPDEEGRHL